MMGPESYGPVVLVASVVAGVMWLLAIRRAGLELRDFHDERSSTLLITTIVGFVCCVGLSFSALYYTVNGSVGWGVAAGVGIIRGALLVGGIVLMLGSGWTRRRRSSRQRRPPA